MTQSPPPGSSSCSSTGLSGRTWTALRRRRSRENGHDDGKRLGRQADPVLRRPPSERQANDYVFDSGTIMKVIR
jgi:hypothetical protein